MRCVVPPLSGTLSPCALKAKLGARLGTPREQHCSLRLVCSRRYFTPSQHGDRPGAPTAPFTASKRCDSSTATPSATAEASVAFSTSPSPPPPRRLSPPPPPPPPLASSSPTPSETTSEAWVELQAYLRHIDAEDPEFIAYADAFAAGRPSSSGADDAAELHADLEHETRFQSASDEVVGDEDSGLLRHNGSDVDEEFGEDGVCFDETTFFSLKRRARRLQNTADVVTPPLVIPGKNGEVQASLTAAAVQQDASALRRATHACVTGPATGEVLITGHPPMTRLLRQDSYLLQQDRLYLGSCTPPELQLLSSAGVAGVSPSAPVHAPVSHTRVTGRCILVVFSATDLRVHDNYLLALASVRARAAAAEGAGSGARHVPVIAVCVLDYRTFAQPSVVGGFFRQSPQRAQYLLDTVAALRRVLEETLHVPLLLRCGRPEEHVPRLAVELGAMDVFLTTQYAPHERRVQALMVHRLRNGLWISREALDANDAMGATISRNRTSHGCDDSPHDGSLLSVGEDPLIAVVEHPTGPAPHQHPYRDNYHQHEQQQPPVVHSVWQSTLVHLDDLPTPLPAMKEGERWYHDVVTVSTIRPTEPYDAATHRLAELPISWEAAALLPTQEERERRAGPSALRGALPRLEDLGYAAAAVSGTDFAFQDVIASQSSHFGAGEEAAVARVRDWLAQGGMTSLLRYGRERRTNTKMYAHTLSRVSPYLALGALSPRRFYEEMRRFAHENTRDNFVQQQFREGLLRLSRRDYWHWMGLRFGDRLFFSYGPHPEQTDDVAAWRHDHKVVQRWCDGLTGIPFADAAMRELVSTGFVAQEGRQALAWLLTRGFGQDWRIGAEWMERCSLDYDPFVCYGNYAYCCGLVLDDFGSPVRNVHYLAHHHDQTGIYIKKWLPQLSKVPPVYVHRPHILTERMQAMHGLYLGVNYPYPLKLWRGAQRSLSAADLPAYYPNGIVRGPGYAEALRYGDGVLQPEEYNAAVTPAYLKHRKWASLLPSSAFADVDDNEEWGEGSLALVKPTSSVMPTRATQRSTETMVEAAGR